MQIDLPVRLILLGAVCVAMNPTFAEETVFPSDVIERVRDATVRVVTTSSDDRPPRIGTGFFWESKDTVVTAFHVVASGRDISVGILKNGDLEYVSAKIVGSDPRVDLAILEVDRIPNVVPLALAPLSDDIDEGTLLVFGYPVGYPKMITRRLTQNDLAPGILGDHLNPEISRAVFAIGFPDLQQPVLSVEGGLVPGYSGAPLVRSDGAVVAIGQGGQQRGVLGFGWAIPGSALSDLQEVADPQTTFRSGSSQLVAEHLYSTVDDRKEIYFSSVFRQSMQASRSKLLGTTNILSNIDGIIESNLQSNHDGTFWSKLSEIWSREAIWLERLYLELAMCLSNFSCSPTGELEEFCGLVEVQYVAYKNIKEAMPEIQAPVTKDYTDAFLMLPPIDLVKYPNTTNIDVVFERVCP